MDETVPFLNTHGGYGPPQRNPSEFGWVYTQGLGWIVLKRRGHKHYWICKECYALQIQGLLDKTTSYILKCEENSEEAIDHLRRQHGRQAHKTKVDWTDEHRLACTLCQRLARRETIEASRADEVGIDCPYSCLMENASMAINHASPKSISFLAWHPSSWNPDEYVIERRGEYTKETWNVYTEPGTRRIDGIEERVDPGPTNDASTCWDFINACLEECETQHPKCRLDPKLYTLPPRLLRIEDKGLRLISSTEVAPETSYVALSYCWGPLQSLRTTQATVEQYMQLIEDELLPPVIKDAVTFTQRVGERYIWIDRLCIEQDNDKDWKYNASIMDNVYENAKVVVAAVTSKAVDAPFLGQISVNPRAQKASAPVFWNNDGSDFAEQVCARVQSMVTSSKYTLDDAGAKTHDSRAHTAFELRPALPLDFRGWTFQERFLARRSVRYEPAQIIFECRTATRMEKSPHDVLPRPGWLASDHASLTLRTWAEAVNVFTHRDLSFASDRAAAILGLAKRYSRALGSSYVAGLWHNGNLLSQLLWEIDSDVLIKELYNQVRDTGKDYSAPEAGKGSPSWSWLSSGLPIRWPIEWQQGDDIADSVYSDIKLVSLASSKPSDKFLQDTTAIVLSAKLLDAVLECRYSKLDWKKEPMFRCIFSKGGKDYQAIKVTVDGYLAKREVSAHQRPHLSSHVTFLWSRRSSEKGGSEKDKDEYPHYGEGAPIKVLVMANGQWDASRTYRALLLTPVGQTSDGLPQYGRIGWMHTDEKINHRMENLSPEEFALV